MKKTKLKNTVDMSFRKSLKLSIADKTENNSRYNKEIFTA